MGMGQVTTHIFLVNGWGDNGTYDGFTNLATDLRTGPFASAGLQVNVCDWNRLFTNNFVSGGDGSLLTAIGADDSAFVSSVVQLINSYSPSDHVILIGSSYGGRSVLDIADHTSHHIDLLATLDPVGPDGFRSKLALEAGAASVIGGILTGDPVGGGILGTIGGWLFGNGGGAIGALWADNLPTVPGNVHYYYNRWQEQGMFPIDYKTSGYIASSASGSLQTAFGIADQSEIVPPNLGFVGGAHLAVANNVQTQSQLLDIVERIAVGNQSALDSAGELFTLGNGNILWRFGGAGWNVY
jgi:hypothetical protein